MARVIFVLHLLTLVHTQIIYTHTCTKTYMCSKQDITKYKQNLIIIRLKSIVMIEGYSNRKTNPPITRKLVGWRSAHISHDFETTSVHFRFSDWFRMISQKRKWFSVFNYSLFNHDYQHQRVPLKYVNIAPLSACADVHFNSLRPSK